MTSSKKLKLKVRAYRPASNQSFVTVDSKQLFSTLRQLVDFGARIISISGVDTGKSIEVLYHFSLGEEIVSLKVPLGREKPKIRTITKVFPGALFFEKELQDMFGINIKGIDKELFLLSEDYVGKPPMRRG